MCTHLEIEEPTSFQEAIDSPKHKEWMEAMRDEMDSMVTNEIRNLLIFLPGVNRLETSGFSR